MDDKTPLEDDFFETGALVEEGADEKALLVDGGDQE